MLLRVIVSENEIRRLSVEDIPSSVKELYQVLRTNLGLRGGLILQFEDPDFNNQLCNLTNIKDLPVDRATLKVLFTADDGSDSTLDTGSLPSTSSGDSVEWPDPFPIPQFSHDVELQLKEANCRYAKDGSLTMIPKSLKTDILDTLADRMSKISAYPERQHYENVAKALVEKHPCLREPGSEKGWYSWFHSLKFKLGNYRQKLSAAGCPEVVVNKRKAGGSKGKCVKKSKKGEVNYCPDPPEGQSSENMEEKRKIMEGEMLKRDPDHQLLEDLMVTTFSQRRKEIIGDQPHITELISRWPALFYEKQVIAQLEFRRIITTDLLESFLDGLDGLIPRLLGGIQSSNQAPFMFVKTFSSHCMAAALLGLPHYISGEDPSAVIRMCDAHVDTLDDALKGIQLGLLIACEGGERSAIPHEVFDVAVVVEETIVLHNIKDVAQSFAMLMGVIYCVNLKYPDDMKYSFEPDQASARVHGLRNKILRYKL
uniref:PB1 domain-containing protein n=1 Tax=Kryptolebias marmoratus TaxID=37003 RepID=A0A3Q3B443_KRYMA